MKSASDIGLEIAVRYRKGALGVYLAKDIADAITAERAIADVGCLTDVMAISADLDSSRTLRLHYTRDVTDEDRARLVAVHNIVNGTPAVKPLVWQEPSRETNGSWTAKCLLGTFSVAFDDGWHAELEDGLRWEWEPEQDPRSYNGPFEAQRACREFYETSIRTTLGSSGVSP